MAFLVRESAAPANAFPAENNSRPAAPANHPPLERAPRPSRNLLRRRRRQDHPALPSPAVESDEAMQIPLALKSTGYKRASDGSVTLSVTLDKDQVECCVCLGAMSGKIYRCRGSGPSASSDTTKKAAICHSVCHNCEWQLRRLKSDNGKNKKMQCPICKVQGPFVRNRALERQLHELSKPCVHAHAGCTRRFFPWDDEQRKVHEKHLCSYQSVDCIFCHQSIPGGRGNFIKHLMGSTSPDSPHISNEIDELIEVADIENDQSQPMDWNSGNGSSDDIDGLASAEYVHEEAPVESMSADQQDSASSDELEEEEKECPHDHRHHPSPEVQGQTVPCCKIAFHRGADITDMDQLGDWVLRRDRNEFVVSHNLGVVVCAVAPYHNTPAWRIFAISISQKHGMSGNSRVYLQHFDYDQMRQYKEKEAASGLVGSYLARPTTSTVMMSLGRLHPTSLRKRFNSYPANNPFLEKINWTKTRKSLLSPKPEEKENGDAEMADTSNVDETQNLPVARRSSVPLEDSDNTLSNDHDSMDQDEELSDLEEHEPEAFSGQSPCADIQCATVFAGLEQYGQKQINNLCIRLFTLEQSFKVGAIIDCRDFTGEYFEAEILAVQDSNGAIYQDIASASDECLEIRRARIHYLGYSGSYDEWLNVDTDSHRMAHRGTFTIGPNLRAIRKNSTNLRHQRLFMRQQRAPAQDDLPVDGQN